MMEPTKRACLVYVTATTGMVSAARARLEAEGYGVCEVLADLDTATAATAQDGSALPIALKDCIEAADLCVFLLPEDGRNVLPEPFEKDAAGIVHDCDEALSEAIRGDRSFKNPDGTARERGIRHLKCQ